MSCRYSFWCLNYHYTIFKQVNMTKYNSVNTALNRIHDWLNSKPQFKFIKEKEKIITSYILPKELQVKPTKTKNDYFSVQPTC